ncbi:MAG: 50S ribosomal protein L11 methyltransferase [Gammaproteobacteria bacterium]|nr:50S ribosomal protein L11 methyltransferase [Gammaproteobacteria bacterium]
MSNTTWQQLSVLRCRDVAAVEQCLQAQGALSISLEDAADQALLEPDPGQHPLWSQTRVSALFVADHDLHSTRAMLQQLGVEAADMVTGAVPDQDWIRAWMQHYRPLQCGRLHICPSHLHAPGADDAVVIRLDPGLAFGTGTHPTTQLCLQWLEQADLSGKVVIDYGCGSGILAIAAARLGAELVYAVDHDAQAVQATRANARNNQVEQTVQAGLTIELRPPPADIVIANIIARPLITLKSTLLGSLLPHGDLVLSGILSPQADVVAASYLPEMRRQQQWQMDDWICMQLVGN